MSDRIHEAVKSQNIGRCACLRISVTPKPDSRSEVLRSRFFFLLFSVRSTPAPNHIDFPSGKVADGAISSVCSLSALMCTVSFVPRLHAEASKARPVRG